MSSLNTVVGALFAYKVIKYLTTPFKDFDAYKLGLIDEHGKQLKTPSNDDEKHAWTIGDRLIIRVKRVLERSGTLGTAATIASAYWLVKECTVRKILPSEKTIQEDIQELLANDFIPLEETIIVESLLYEDSGMITTGAIGEPSEPVINNRAARQYKEFNVSDETFLKFSKGKKKFDKWSNYLNMEDENDLELYNYAKKNHRAIIVLKNGDKARAIRFNRRGGGNWSNHQRQINEEVSFDGLDIHLKIL